MREKIIKKASSSVIAVIGLLLLFIFILGMKRPQQKTKITYLALGDSYTIGEKVAGKDNFPNQTVAQLKTNGVSIQQATIVAKTGWTTDELKTGIASTKLLKQYDFVTLLIGVNNQYRGRKVVDFIPEFEDLLNKAIQLAGNDTSHVMVLSIPDWGITPFAEGRDRKKISAEIDEYNTASQLIAEKAKVKYLNITNSTRKAAEDNTLLTDDGLHPSAKEYAKWAEQVAIFIKSKI